MFAVAGRLGLGWAFHRIGHPGWPGAAATAAAAGLLLGDAVGRGYFYRDDIPLAAIISIIGLALLVWLTQRDRRRQLPRAALLTAPATSGAVLLLAAPDVIEQLVFIGF
ncbi:MAG: hypothetical protein LH603_19530 [Pseudonocardia sp.]|nr:hypothetical protein [Pseudonocardia sp.]